MMGQDGSIVPLFGTGSEGFAPTISAQRRTNLYVDLSRSDQDKGVLALCPRPGMDFVAAATMHPTVSAGPRICRGFARGEMIVPAAGNPLSGFLAMGNDLMFFIPTASGVSIGSYAPTVALRSESGAVRFGKDSTYVACVDGVTGYALAVATTTGYVFADLPSAAAFPAGATTCCFLASRMIANKPGTGRFYWSAQNDPLTWNSLDFATAEASPDNLLAVAVDHGELLLFGQYTTEIWAPSGGSSPFVRVGGAAVEYGICAVDSICALSDGTIFLARNVAGDTKVMMMTGASVRAISTPAIEVEIERLSDVQGAAGLSIIANGKTFYILSFDERTFAYNMTDGEWSRWQTGVDDGPWCGKHGALIAGKFYVADATRNRFYVLNPESSTDGGDVIAREVVTKHVHNDYDRFGIDKLGLDFETGIGVVSGQGADPQVMLQVSRDNGHTWGNEVWASAGALGNYVKRVWFRSLGRSRDWLFKIRWTDPVLTVLTGGSIKVRR